MRRVEGYMQFDPLFKAVARLIRATLDYNRVMVYRFLNNGAGRVVAEAKEPWLGSFLSQHFPVWTFLSRRARSTSVIGSDYRRQLRLIPRQDEYTSISIGVRTSVKAQSFVDQTTERPKMCNSSEPDGLLYSHDISKTETSKFKPSSCAGCRMSRPGCPGNRHAKILALEEREAGVRHR